MTLCEKYKFPSLFINQFYPRPGTPAANMQRIPANEVKKRTKALTNLFNTYEPYSSKLGEIQEVLVTEISHDKNYYVGHNKFYEQVLVPINEKYMGKLLTVKIISTTKFSMLAEVVDEAIIRNVTLIKPLEKGILSGISKPEMKSNNQLFFYTLITLCLAILYRFLWLIF